jgi:small subunit ribosomal protein S4
MGHPRKIRRKFSRPSHPWQKLRIDEENALAKEFGLVKKREIWRLGSLLSNFKAQAKRLSASRTEQSKKETVQLMKRLSSYGLVAVDSSYDDVLSIPLKKLLERRLQSVLFAKKLAKTMKQARQMITHNHVSVGLKTISSPSYLVKINEENSISFRTVSPFSDDEHPERKRKDMEEVKEEVKKLKEQIAEKKSEEKAKEAKK